jgi:hypothetical protein
MVAHPRPIFAPSIFPKINTRPSPRATHFSTIPGRPSRTSGDLACSRRLWQIPACWGRVFGRTLIFHFKVKMPFSSRFAYVLLQFFPPRTPQQLLPTRRRSGAKPLNSAAEAGATSGLDLPQGALFHSALTPGSWHWRISWCKASAKAVIARNTTMSRCRVLKGFIWRSFMDCSSRSLLAALPPRFPVTSSGHRAQHSSVATSIGFGLQQVAGAGRRRIPGCPYVWIYSPKSNTPFIFF